MPVGRKRKPAAQRIAEGNPGHRPIPDEPDFPGQPKMPDFLDKGARKEWRRIIAALADLDLLKATDTAVLAMYCVAYSRWQTSEEQLTKEGTVITVTGSKGQNKLIKNPTLTISGEAMRQVASLGALLGFNPSDRSKVAAPPKNAKDSFSDL
jgi:P27 family predicted phage terminase small subunit